MGKAMPPSQPGHMPLLQTQVQAAPMGEALEGSQARSMIAEWHAFRRQCPAVWTLQRGRPCRGQPDPGRPCRRVGGDHRNWRDQRGHHGPEDLRDGPQPRAFWIPDRARWPCTTPPACTDWFATAASRSTVPISTPRWNAWRSRSQGPDILHAVARITETPDDSALGAGPGMPKLCARPRCRQAGGATTGFARRRVWLRWALWVSGRYVMPALLVFGLGAWLWLGVWPGHGQCAGLPDRFQDAGHQPGRHHGACAQIRLPNLPRARPSRKPPLSARKAKSFPCPCTCASSCAGRHLRAAPASRRIGT